jgi:hypothetical protein
VSLPALDSAIGRHCRRGGGGCHGAVIWQLSEPKVRHRSVTRSTHLPSVFTLQRRAVLFEYLSPIVAQRCDGELANEQLDGILKKDAVCRQVHFSETYGVHWIDMSQWDGCNSGNMQVWKGDITDALGMPLIDENLTLIAIEDPIRVVGRVDVVSLAAARITAAADLVLLLESEKEVGTPSICVQWSNSTCPTTIWSDGTSVKLWRLRPPGVSPVPNTSARATH